MNESSSLDWEGLHALAAIAEAGSLRGAAEIVHISQPTLGRRIRALEEALDTTLLVRHSRGVDFTDDGKVVLDAARETVRRLETLQRTLQGRRTALEGRVRLTCTEPVAMELLPPVLQTLAHLHPGIAIDMAVDAHAVDLDRRAADIAIRMFQPRQPNLVARRLGEAATVFCASRSYLDAHPAPTSMAELFDHTVVGPDRDPLFVDAARAMGFPLDRCRYRTDSFAVALAWTRAGLAIAALVDRVADRDPELVAVLTPIQRYPVWLVTHPDVLGAATVRAVWDHLATELTDVFQPQGPPTGV